MKNEIVRLNVLKKLNSKRHAKINARTFRKKKKREEQEEERNKVKSYKKMIVVLHELRSTTSEDENEFVFMVDSHYNLTLIF